jgi:acetyltransferase
MGPEPGREVTRLNLEEEGWPTFDEIHRTVRVMASLFEQYKYTNKSSEIRSFEFPMTPSLKELAQQPNERGDSILDEHEAKKWLQALDLKVVKEVIVKDLGEAATAANEMGYPIVLKGRVEGQIHKTEAGLVKLNLCNEGQLRSAYQEMSNLKPKPQSFLIQPMLKGDLELIVGIIRDPQFGPAAMLGLGGIWTEVYRDVVFRLLPLNQQDLFEMVSELKGKDLFRGYRGSKTLNMKVLADWLIRLGWLAMKFEKIQEIDVNPLLIVEGEPVAVDATIILRGTLFSHKQIEINEIDDPSEG